MPEEDYDLAGFAVGVCDKKEMIAGENLEAGRCAYWYGFHWRTFKRIFTGTKVFEKK